MSRSVEISPADPRAPEAQALLKASHALMDALFPSESNHYMTADDLSAPGVLFFLAQLDGHVAGCGALVLKDGYGEIKSMFVDPARRGGRIGSRLLERLEKAARDNGQTILRLETGDTLTAARRLYASHGYRECAPFGEYRKDPRSIFMEKEL